ncbi:hypothetical protein HDU92_002196 [Lobulomyces angularis]|nr:hypothetical protein HDU92_002196 [Lobulomyces angularis]
MLYTTTTACFKHYSIRVTISRLRILATEPFTDKRRIGDQSSSPSKCNLISRLGRFTITYICGRK